uniref:F-box/LRR-repeat protein 6-like n=1 Tax=Dermatophagoides pteronyssinus TaxID=6956 RepID=A0A6P6YAB7_DERPT|nr:F-box/LRR-repeat protein 6-like [Dermatophagoides pteronyssinus]
MEQQSTAFESTANSIVVVGGGGDGRKQQSHLLNDDNDDDHNSNSSLNNDNDDDDDYSPKCDSINGSNASISPPIPPPSTFETIEIEQPSINRRTRSMMKTKKQLDDTSNGHPVLNEEKNGEPPPAPHDDDYDSYVMDDNDDDDDDDYEPEESKDYDDVDYVIGGDVDRTVRSSKSSQNSSITTTTSTSSSTLKNKKRKSSSSSNDKRSSKKSKPKATNQETVVKSSSSGKKSQKTNSNVKNCINQNINQNSSSSSSSSGMSNNFRHLFQPNEHEFKQIFPPELLTRLFKMTIESNSPESPILTLIRLSQVCEYWRQLIITSPALWSTIDLSSLSESRFPMDRFRRLHQENRLFQSVQHIDLSNWKADMAKKMLEFLTDCSQYDLHSLSIRRCRNITAPFLQSVIAHAGNLRLLNISGITASQQHNCQNPFQTPSFRPLIERCGESLRSLFMSENMMTSFPTCFYMVLESCPNLEVLDISNVHSLGSRCSTIPIDKFQQSCPNMRVLRAANIAFQPIGFGCTTDGWPRLEELSIPFNLDFMVSAGHSDLVLEQLTKSSENLKLLDIRGSPNITPRGLVKIPAWSLKHLSISNCPKMQDETLGMVFQKWNKSLVDVDLSWNKSETCIDECVRSICDLSSDDVKLCTIDLRGSAISLESLRRLILHCGERLKSIDLQSCRSLPRGMKRLFQGEEFQRLRQLMLDGRCDD